MVARSHGEGLAAYQFLQEARIQAEEHRGKLEALVIRSAP